MYVKRFAVMQEANGGTPPQGGAGGGGTPPQGGGAAATWYDGFKDPEVKDWLKAYGTAYPDPEAVARKALHLEKFVGVEKSGRGVIMPKPEDDAKTWREFFAKVGGVPEKPEGYRVEDEKLSKDPLIGKFRTWAHEAGMPPRMFEAMIPQFGKFMAETQTARMREFEAQAEREHNEVMTAWGSEADANIELGRRAAKQFIPHSKPEELETILNKLEGALGTANTMRFLANVGKMLTEGKFVDGDGGGGGGGMTPEAARARIKILQKDKQWGQRFVAGGAAEKEEWEKLHKIGYPNDPA